MNEGVNTQVPQKKSNTVLWIVLGIVGGLFLLGIGAVVLVILLFSVSFNSHPYYGNWSCTSSVKMQIDANTLKMQYGTSGEIEATYTMTVDKEGTVTKYNMTATATKRVLNGVNYTSPYTTGFQIIMESGNKGLVMSNTNSGSIYTCTREK